MFRTIAATIQKDTDLPDRAWKINVYSKLLDGTFYDNLLYEFWQETNFDQYIPISQRSPSVRSGLLRVVVDDSVSLLFSEGHFPTLEPVEADKEQRDTLALLARSVMLNQVMIDAATVGAAGSVAIMLSVLRNAAGEFRPFLKVFNTAYLTPTWEAQEPDKLASVEEKRKVKGSVLKALGYSFPADSDAADYWYARRWTKDEEIWFEPWPANDIDKAKGYVKDKKRSVLHKMGFVPIVWVKNLAGGDDTDGASTLTPEAINTVIEIDYQLSQAGRGLRYSSDPLLLIKSPAAPEGGGDIVRSSSNAIITDENGDAKLVEISGSASTAVIDYVRALRELALESLKGNRTSADKISAAQSGRAMELMNQALIWLADRLRITYGEGALLSLVTMIAAASEKFPMTLGAEKKVVIKLTGPITAKWPRWYAPTSGDRNDNANTLKTHIDSGVMSEETATNSIAADYDILDVAAERDLIEKERLEESESKIAMAQAMSQQLPK